MYEFNFKKLRDYRHLKDKLINKNSHPFSRLNFFFKVKPKVYFQKKSF